MTTRVLTNTLEKKIYAILGHNIAYSVSPQMQGGAFGATRLPHKYVRADMETVEEFVEGNLFQGESFGGCSVTIPHKQSIIPYVDVLSDAAKAIGSCNTLIAKDEVDVDVMKRVIYGDNTDWKGIFNPLNRLLGGQADPNSEFALILGAGGTARAAAYVAEKLGLQRIYYNRTPEKAQDLVDSFGGEVVGNLEENGDDKSLGQVLKRKGGSVRVVISTLPAAANFLLPDWLLPSKTKNPIVFDVNYKPYNTKLLLKAQEAGCDLVRGSEMLWEQGIGQFELWTNRTAPYGFMKNVVLRNCMTTEDQS
jgi:pentafunctional AROM polypeptide